MPTREVQLSKESETLIKQGVAAGRYREANEAIALALHLLERDEEDEAGKLDWLRNAAQEAIESLDRGEGMTFESVEEFGKYLRSMARDVSKDPGSTKQAA